MRKLPSLLLALLLVCMAGHATAQGVLRIGLVEDPDTLDPTLNRLATGRQPMTALCDKLFDVKPDLSLTPQLATGYKVSEDGKSVMIDLRSGVTFHDGETLDANALLFNIKRHMTLPGSLRRTELSMVDHLEVANPSTVRFVLNAPQANLLLYSLAERAGMMVAPKAAQQLGDHFGSQPICAGEYRFVERVPQGRIVVEKFAGYWDAAHTVGDPDRIEYLPIGDSTVRLSSLRSGQIQIAERLTPTDLLQVANDPRVKVVSAPDLGYHYIRYNSGNGPRSALFHDVRVRHAVDLAIDRRVLVKSLFNDRYQPGNQFVSPASPYYDPAEPVPERDVAASRELLQQAGISHLTFTLLVPPERERQEAAQMVQAMLAEAGITMKIETQDDAVMLQNARRGNFDAIFNFWSGRPHPDGNVYAQYSCNGPTNDSRFCDPAIDKAMVAAREASTDEARQRLYREVNGMLARDYPSSVLWHRRTFTGLSAKLTGFVAHPDSTIRVKGLHLQP